MNEKRTHLQVGRPGRRAELTLGLAVAVVHRDLRAPRGRALEGIVALGVEGLGARVGDRDLDAVAPRGAARARAVAAAGTAVVAAVLLIATAPVYPEGQPLLVEPVVRSIVNLMDAFLIVLNRKKVS